MSEWKRLLNSLLVVLAKRNQQNLVSKIIVFNKTIIPLALVGYIEITSWKARAYGIFTRVGEVPEIERVSAANE